MPCVTSRFRSACSIDNAAKIQLQPPAGGAHSGHLKDMNRLQEPSRRNISASWPGQNRSDGWIGDVHQHEMIQRIAKIHLPGRPLFATGNRLGREGQRSVDRFDAQGKHRMEPGPLAEYAFGPEVLCCMASVLNLAPNPNNGGGVN